MEIEFNHLYITLDPVTLKSIVESKFISQQFCALSQDTVQTEAESWTGIYLRGKCTYLELFAPGGAFGLKEGFSGIGFNTKRYGDIDMIDQHLQSLVAQQTTRGLRIRQTEDGEVPWFYHLAWENSQDNGFDPWLMEFHQDYLNYKGIKLSDTGCFNRKAYMINLSDSETSLFEDISEVHLELTPLEHENLKLLLRTFGYQSSCCGEAIIYNCGDFTLHIAEMVEPIYRIRQVVCTIADQPSQEKSFAFAPNAHLNVGKKSAIWRFGEIN